MQKSIVILCKALKGIIMEDFMILNKKIIAGVSAVAVFCSLLAGVAINFDDNRQIECESIGLLSAAGAIAHIHHDSDTTTAGVTGTIMEETVAIVDIETDNVGQGTTDDPEDLTAEFETFGYTNLGLAEVISNLNVRNKPSLEGAVVGKLTNYAACEILGEENGWYKITSGNVEGYVSKDYVLTGKEALEIAQKEAQLMVTVTTETLRVRKGPSVDTTMLTTVSKDADLYVLEVLDGWIKVQLDNNEGYVSSEFVTINKKLKTGHTLKELQYGIGISETRVNLVNFALQFVGNRYVWGGESLQYGVDCSGFTMKVYEQFGVYLPHYSGSQPAYGTRIDPSQAKPGDLFFYTSSSRIDHVAIYIGNGQIVHAASARSGIIISSAYYRTPVCVVSYLD